MNFPIFNVPSDLKFSSKTMSEPKFAGKFSEFLKDSGPQTKEEVNAEIARGLIPILKQQAINMSPEGMERQLEMARKDAFQKGKTGLMFSTLANLPQTIANAVSPYGGPEGARMAYEGMSRIPGIYSETMRSFPQIQVPASSYSSTRYF